jgi:hypothetical protein
MSVRLLLNRAMELLRSDVHTGPKDDIRHPETDVANQETQPTLPLGATANNAAWFDAATAWDPVALAKVPVCNDPAHANSLAWANRPAPMEQSRRLLGFSKDESAPLRRVETMGHVPDYLVVSGAKPLTTLPPTPGFLVLPR